MMKMAPPLERDDTAAWLRATRTAWEGRRGPDVFRRSASPCVEVAYRSEKGWSKIAVQDIDAGEIIDEMTLEDVDFRTSRKFERYGWSAYGPKYGLDSKKHCIHSINEPSPREAINAVISRERGDTREGQDVWVLQTTRRIRPGDEVLTWYGPDFGRDYTIDRDAEMDFRNGIEQAKDDEYTSEEEETYVDTYIDHGAENYREPSTEELRDRRRREERRSRQYGQKPKGAPTRSEWAEQVAEQNRMYHRESTPDEDEYQRPRREHSEDRSGMRQRRTRETPRISPATQRLVQA